MTDKSETVPVVQADRDAADKGIAVYVMDEKCPYSSEVLAAYFSRIASTEALEAQVKVLREALERIRDRGWVDNALDPQWAAEMARTALSNTGEV